MDNVKDLERRIEAIENRNKKVELDKAWQDSWSRKAMIAILTFLLIGIYMQIIGISHPWINAIIPTLGFILSTLALPFIKDLWIKFIYKK